MQRGMKPISGRLLILFLVLVVDSTKLRGSTNTGRLSKDEADARWPNLNCKMFALWDYKHGVPFFVKKDIQSWRLHTHHKCGDPIFINETNVMQYIPDLPQEYFRFPDDGSRSDFIRYALLYHHGGMYMDTDILVAKDMDDVLDKINGEWDLVSYTNQGKQCKGFSSNFLAGRKGSSLYKAVWEEQKRMVRRECPKKFTDSNKGDVCCSEKFCHVPWGGLGERVSHPIYDQWIKEKKPFRFFCYSEQSGESFNPEGLGTVLFAKYTVENGENWWLNVQKTPKAEDRMAYHLFNNLGFYSLYSDSGLFDPDYVVGKLFRKALKGVVPESEYPPLPWKGDPAVHCANQGEMCVCSGKVYFGRRYKRVEGVETTDPIDFRGLTTFNYKAQDVKGSVLCNVEGFGGEAIGGREHACWCQAADSRKSRSPLELGSAAVCAEDGQMCNCKGNVYYGRKYVSEGKLLDSDFQSLLSIPYRAKIGRAHV
eukprot:TRINITY_DN16910_c0_g2_i1.p1 TRINITY_DN16910_c0_g2~~TRINITY_DN16910_c0_g2_i1.p1  ORF type:complete len:481 (+),score=76.81 TRINITY_DN16910_c0_g2_i1:57-1499(+)